MRLKPWRWLWGLVPVAMLCFIALLAERERIETDLRARAQEGLKSAGYAWAASSFNGRDAILTGQAAEDAEPNDAGKRMLSTWGVRVVDNRAELIEKADVYNWSAIERDNRIRLTGYVPNDSTRKAIMGVIKATLPKREVEDRMKLARGAPPRDTWLSGVSFALKNLAHLKNGTVELEGINLSIAGPAEDAAGFKTIKAALANSLPQGIKLKSDKVTPAVVSPYTWSARLDGNKLQLSGHVPNDQQRHNLAAAAKEALPRSSLVDTAELADGAPEGFGAAAIAVIREFGRLEDGAADLRGNQLNVGGTASTDVIAEAVRKSLRERMPATIRLTEAIKFKALAVPTFDPFRTSMDATPSTVVLSGHAPSEAAKTAMGETARARLPGRRIDNQLVVGNGAPNGWQACTQYALAGLGRLGGGKSIMTNGRMQMTGETADEALHESLPGELAQAIGNSCDATIDISLKDVPEPNLTWRASRSAGQLVLEGDVPDQATKGELAQSAGRLFPGVTIVDRTRIANVPARRWKQVADDGLHQLARLSSGSAEISGQQLAISGEAPERSVAAAIKEHVTRHLAKGYGGRDTIEVRTDADIAADEVRRRGETDAKRRTEEEAKKREEVAALDARHRTDDARRRAEEAEAKRKAEQTGAEARKAEAERCQETLRRVSRAGVILFERASADINAKSHTTLNELVRAVQACPAVTVEIEGHTDIEGAADRNLRLSERRAQSVRQYLADAGADPARLVAIGYGQEKPIAPNDTPENRAKNRRIEFTVKAK